MAGVSVVELAHVTQLKDKAVRMHAKLIIPQLREKLFKELESLLAEMQDKHFTAVSSIKHPGIVEQFNQLKKLHGQATKMAPELKERTPNKEELETLRQILSDLNEKTKAIHRLAIQKDE